jgi:serine/threonine-protein kinase
MQPYRWTRGQELAQRATMAVFLSVLLASVLLARRHLRLGRGDRAGARRLGAYTFAVTLAVWALDAHHVADRSEIQLAGLGLGTALLVAASVFVLYLALEPYVRRRWPQTIVSWTRLLGGGLRDPLVGRDVLIGLASGGLFSVLVMLAERVPGWLGAAPPRPLFNVDVLSGARPALSAILDSQIGWAGFGMGILLLLVFLRFMLRRAWLATLALILLMGANQSAYMDDVPQAMALAFGLAIMAVPILVLVRFGLLACLTAFYVVGLVVNLALNPVLGHWTAQPTVMALAVLGGLALHAFRTALAGQPMFGRLGEE